MKRDLLERISDLGYPLLETEKISDVYKTLSEVVKSSDTRLWEGFPLLLANVYEKGLLDKETVQELLRNIRDKAHFKRFILLSLALYKSINLKFKWADKLYKSLSTKDKQAFESFLKKIKKNQEFKIADRRLQAQRIRDIFNNYFIMGKESEMERLRLKHEELTLEYALSRVFSPGQKELFLKKVRGEKLSKTEKEYFSRVVKKKVVALADTELHRLAQRLLKV